MGLRTNMNKNALIEKVIEKLGRGGFTYKKLNDNKVNLTKEEREKVKKLKAEWSDERSAIFKSVINGKPYYVTHTHRAFQYSPKLEEACKMFHDFIKDTA